MFYWSITSVVHFWPPPIFNPGYAYGRAAAAHVGNVLDSLTRAVKLRAKAF